MNFYTFRKQSEDNFFGEKKASAAHRTSDQSPAMEAIDEIGRTNVVLF